MKKVIHFFAAVSVVCATAFPMTVCSAETEVLPQEKFIERARRPGGGETWGKFSGVARHKRRGGEMESADIYFGINLQRERMIGQIVLGNESYLIGQNFNNAIGTVSPGKEGGYGKNSIMSRFGISPSDLTMSFLYYPVKKELPDETFKLVKCRVFELEIPEKAGGGKVRVWIARDYFSTLKAEFFSASGDVPLRTLEVESYKQQDGLYYVETLNLYGSGWRTQIVFNQAQLGYVKPGERVDVYQKK